MNAEEIAFKIGGAKGLGYTDERLDRLHKLSFSLMLRYEEVDGEPRPKNTIPRHFTFQALNFALFRAMPVEMVGGSRDGEFVDNAFLTAALVAALPNYCSQIHAVVRDRRVEADRLRRTAPVFCEFMDLTAEYLPEGETSAFAT